MPEPLFLFAPGAGAPSTSPWMKAWRRRLATLGPVVTLDYEGLHLPKNVAAHRAALARARRRHPGREVVLIGKSMGSRVGCHVAAEDPTAARALVCLGYPLVGQNGTVRDEVLLALRTPILFVQGTRDAMCPLEHLARVRARMTAPSALHVVDTGDHSLVVTKSSGVTQADVDVAILEAIRAFVVGSRG